MAQDKYQSLSGEKDTEDKYNGEHGWATTRAKAVEDRVQVWRKKDGVNPFTTVADFQNARSSSSENNGQPPPWVSLDLTAFVSEDIQKAFNQIKDMADEVIAYAQAVSSTAKLIASILAANASLIETAINAIRNEIKDILDNLLGLGGVYVLYVPPGKKGGIDYFKKTFYDSLKDVKDPSRPQFGNTTRAHAIFLLWGAPSLEAYLEPFSKLKKFLLPGVGAIQGDTHGSRVPAPANVQVKTIFAPVYKTSLISNALIKQDILYNIASDKASVEKPPENDWGIARIVEGYLAAAERATALQSWVTWDIPENVDSFVMRDTENPEACFYNKVSYFSPVSSKDKDGTSVKVHEFVREDIRLTHWVLARSNDPDGLAAITEEHAAVLEAIKTKQDQVATKGLKANEAVIVGRLIPGLNFYSDSDIFDLTQPEADSLKATLLPDPTQKDKKILNFHYKIMFWGKKVVRKMRFVEAGDGGTSFFGGAPLKKYNVYFSKKEVAHTHPEEPFATTADTTREIEDIREVLEYRMDYAKCDAYYEGMINLGTKDAPDSWVHSTWSEDQTTTNETLKLPGFGPLPNWYAAKGVDLVPPLKRLVERAKAFVDSVADALIESLNTLLAYVQSVLDYIDDLTKKIIKLMELIKSLLLPPIAGIHYLSLTTDRGVDGIKKQFDLSFTKSPTSATGEKDYPDEYVKYGARVPFGKKLLDLRGKNEGQKLAEKQGETGGTPSSSDPVEERKSQDSNAVQQFTAFTKEVAEKFSSVTNSRGKRKSEPSDEDLRRLGIPIYDSNHFTGGFVFFFETITAMSAFTRLLNLNSFISQVQKQTDASLVGYREFSDILTASLKVEKPQSREDKLLTRIGKIPKKRLNDDEAQQEEKDLGKQNGNVDTNGNEHVITQGATFGPAKVAFVVAGIPFLVDFPAAVDAGTAASKINKAYHDVAATFFGLKPGGKISKADLSKLQPYADILGNVDNLVGKSVDDILALLGVGDICSVAEGKLVFNTPPPILGDGSRQFKVSESSDTLDPALKPGFTMRGHNLKTNAAIKLRNLPLEIEFQETVFPIKPGDLIMEVQEFGTPNYEMLRALPAIYEFNDFVSDKAKQTFSPSQCHLILDVDGLARQTVDVTGNNGANSADAGATITFPSTTDSIQFPLTLNPTNNRFKISIFGSFVPVENLSSVNGDGLNQTLTRSNTDWASLGVAVGDLVTVSKTGFDPFTSPIDGIDGSTLTLKYIIPFSSTSGEITITKIVKGGVPSFIATSSVPSFSAEVTIAETDLSTSNPSAEKTYTTLSSLMQDIVRGLLGAGVDPGAIKASYVDESTGQDQSKGKIKLQLDGAWAHSALVTLRVEKPDHSGAPPAILTSDVSTAFPLTVDSHNDRFRIEVLGPESPVPAGVYTVTLTHGSYSNAASLATEMTSALASLGLDGVVVTAVSNSLQIAISAVDEFNNPLGTDWSYSSLSNIKIRGLVPLATTALPEDFTDGVPVPPSLTLSGLTVPITVKSGYADVFELEIYPVVSSRPSGLTTVTIPAGTYSTIAELEAAVATALVSAGFTGADTGYIRLRNSGSNITLSLRPETNYTSPTAYLSVKNTRSVQPTLTGAVLDLPELRDYDYTVVYAWLTAHPGVTPTPGFPTPAPRIFQVQNLNATSYTPVYNGSWVVDSSNNSFQMKVDSPITSIPSGWQTITIANATYTSAASVALAMQTAINAIYGASFVTVSTFGTDQLRITVTGATAKGVYTTVSLQQNGSANFLSYGSTTSGALFVSGSGTGDRTFMEIMNLADATAYGSTDLVGALGIMTGVTSLGSDGVPYLQAYGTSDFNFLRMIDMPAHQETGSSKQGYTLANIVSAINAHFAGVSAAYGKIAENYLENGRLRISGLVKGSKGLIRIIAMADTAIAGSAESAAVAALLFGYDEPRQSQVEVKGLGQAPTCSLLEAFILDEDTRIVEVLDLPSFEAVTLEPEFVVEILSLEPLGWIAEVLSLGIN